jgi:hypothetical protein
MPVLSQPSFAPRAALIYITVGVIIGIFTGTYWFFYVRGLPVDEPGLRTTLFWVVSFFLLGLTLMLIGFFLGRIGRAARHAELPPPEAMTTEKKVEQQAATNPAGVNPMMTGVPVAPVMPVPPASPAGYPLTQPTAAPAAGGAHAVPPAGAASKPPRQS